ncbi:DUF308 domain-containing protein [Neorhizobium sp. NCHU2750]|uniref:HdeD family acid-resistance protein n=1 Tax=Neorhizobium sp. NCHU2750 TaxID=1825976 RepID=UPI000E74A0C8|nr:hypothetical protein NCHU2750_36110 [Neorhizobium sp. NCHU2750]
MTSPPRPATTSRQIVQLKRRQGNILVAGILFAAAGLMFFCNIIAVAGVSWPVIGLMLIATGMLQFYAIWQIRQHVHLPAWGLVVVFYITFGLFALTAPGRRFAGLALVFFAGLVAIGILRCHCGYVSRRGGRGWYWLLAGGTVTVAIGGLLALRWPLNELSLVSQLLAIDLALNGLALIAFAVQLGHAAADGAKERTGDR